MSLDVQIFPTLHFQSSLGFINILFVNTLKI
jgi:hypothetical protein